MTSNLTSIRADLLQKFGDKITSADIESKPWSINRVGEAPMESGFADTCEIHTDDGGVLTFASPESPAFSSGCGRIVNEIEAYLTHEHGYTVELTGDDDFDFETKIGGDTDDFDHDFEDGFDFLDDEPEPQGPRP